MTTDPRHNGKIRLCTELSLISSGTCVIPPTCPGLCHVAALAKPKGVIVDRAGRGWRLPAFV